jgi:hypothetical protein
LRRLRTTALTGTRYDKMTQTEAIGAPTRLSDFSR